MVRRVAMPLSTILATLCIVGGAGASRADDYYKDKQITLILGYNPGGGYDLHARLVANALPRHIPGNPKIILRHMPGAGSVIAANFLHGQSSDDGLTIGLVGQQLAVAQALKDQSVRYDLRDFKALGRVAKSVEATIVWHTSPVKSLSDAMERQITIAATSAGSTSHSLPLLVSRITGAKFRLVTGYPGVTGAGLAMERGETDGAHATVSGLMFSKANWLKENKISVLVQYAMERDPSLPDTPAMTEFGKTPDEKKILAFFASPAEVGYSFLAPPKTPPERVQTMRQSFSRMLDDPAFASEMKSRNLNFDPLSGEKLQALIVETLSIDPELVERGRALSRE
jgi:tripartite-type tricarboxylate transporter receptor subunit TctC